MTTEGGREGGACAATVVGGWGGGGGGGGGEQLLVFVPVQQMQVWLTVSTQVLRSSVKNLSERAKMRYGPL